MTFKELADLLGVSAQTVRRAFAKLYPEQIENGLETRMTLTQSKAVVSSMRVKASDRLSLAEPLQNVKVVMSTDSQSIVALLRTAADEIDKRDRQIAVLAPKAEIHDQIADAGNAKTVAQVAQVLGTGQKRLFKFMRDSGILSEHNRPYQEHVDAKRLIVRETTVRIGEQIVTHPQVFITGKGELWLAGLMNPVASRLLQ